MSSFQNKNAPVYIIGDTPLACLLAIKLSLSNQKVIKITSSKKDNEQYFFQQGAHIHKQRISIPCTFMMREPAKLVFLCLDESDKTDSLLHISRAFTQSSPIVCFGASDIAALTDTLKREIIPAYFDGWAKLNGDTLVYYGCQQGITLSLNEKTHFATAIRDILLIGGIKFSFSEDDTQNFWNHFIPYAACSLFNKQNGQRFKELGKNLELRQQMSVLINELLRLSPESFAADKDALLNMAYATPAKYSFPFADKDIRAQNRTLLFLLKVLQRSSAFSPQKCPVVFNLLKQTVFTDTSPVE